MSEFASTDLQELGDLAIRLPAEVAADPRYVALYQEWLEKLRAEAVGIPMHTVQQFLLERIASGYVVIRYRENEDTWATPTMARGANAHWLDLVKEWNKVLAANQELQRDAVARAAEQAALDSLSMIEDPELRGRLRQHFKERFSAIGL